MAIRHILGVLLLVLPALALSDGSAPVAPDTPAGHALVSWLNVFNGGDRAGLESFVTTQAS